MNLDPVECWRRVTDARHGVLATVHRDRGVDAVPVVFALVRSVGAPRRPPVVVMPVDTVKPKRSKRLQRQANLRRDARCVLLVDHYDDHWPNLWWVRIHGRGRESSPEEMPGAVEALAERYPQYRDRGSVIGIIALEPTTIVGWSGGSGSPGAPP